MGGAGRARGAMSSQWFTLLTPWSPGARSVPADVVDLRSDTVTVPSSGMRAAMATAEVGDDVWGEDPTVRRLEERVALLLDKEAAVYVPSGTMGNLASVAAQTRPGDEVIADV